MGKEFDFEIIRNQAAEILRKSQARKRRPRQRLRKNPERNPTTEFRTAILQRKINSIWQQVQEFGEEGGECPWCHATPYQLEVANYRLTAFAAGALTISYPPTDYNAELAEQVRIINKTITGYDDQ